LVKEDVDVEKEKGNDHPEREPDDVPIHVALMAKS
jgi:hypothetical protein